jgi:hypothetical protein
VRRGRADVHAHAQQYDAVADENGRAVLTFEVDMVFVELVHR